MKLQVVLNPASARGRTVRQWPALAARLSQLAGPFVLSQTTGPGQATELTRKAIYDGADWILAVGGDGTLNEVLNGFFEGEQLINPAATLSVLMSGTGGDFRRSLDLSPTPKQALSQIIEKNTRRLDVGRVRLTGHQGEPVLRHFLNIASFGLGGAVSNRLNGSVLAARLGGKSAFFLATLEVLSHFQPQGLSLRLEGPAGELRLQTRVRQVSVANGRYQGGGMHMAPRAQLDDGLFDIVMLEDHGLAHSVTSFGKVYQGRHLEDPLIRYLQATRVIAEPLDGAELLLEVDGETPGKLPASFEILPGILNFR